MLPMADTREDVWIPTACDMCYNGCTVRVHRVDGVAVKIEGIPEAGPNYGATCAKGLAALMNVYSPNRITAPMVRTNPEKGIGVDPGWKEISWDEAMELLVSKLQAAREKDPRSILGFSFDRFTLFFMRAWAAAMGTPNIGAASATFFCGNASHPVAFNLTGSNELHPDLHHCKHLVMFGASLGFVAGHNAMGLTQEMAEARARGMKLTVIDPVLSYAASQADEWIPIRPGTDAALALGLMHEWVIELDQYDQTFLKRYTNAPYLIGPDGRYVRDRASGKPLVGLAGTGRTAAFDAVAPDETALEGRFIVEGQDVCPAFVAVRGHLEPYTPERVSDLTTIPAATIRRLAREMAEAAEIGQTIQLDGDVLPLRPVAVAWYRGISAHKHAMHTGMLLGQLNVMLGAVDVPGGILNAAGSGPDWMPQSDADGMITPGNPYGGAIASALPRRKVKPPETLDLMELFPVSVYAHAMMALGILRGDEFGVPYKPEVLIQCRGNIMTTGGDPETLAEALRQIPFQCSMAVFPDETNQFADLLLPDTHSLERLVPLVSNPYYFFTNSTNPDEHYTWNLQQPVVKAVPAARPWGEVLLDTAERMGLEADLYSGFNAVFRLTGVHQLRRDRHYSWEDISDAWMRFICGDEHGLEYFKEHGFYKSPVTRSGKAAYPRAFHGSRIPLYMEHYIDAGEMVKAYTDSRGVEWDTSDYTALMDYKPCLTDEQAPAQYDLWVVNQKLPFMTFSHSSENPWLVDLASRNTKVYAIGINPATATKKGIRDGDPIVIESPEGKRATGPARLTEGIHPDCLAAPGVLGRWVLGNRPAKGRGVHVNSLMTYRTDRMDHVSAALDSCVKVKVSRASA
jgi:molybdopterin-containing oxidoreductase family molybdopterin binding subunit